MIKEELIKKIQDTVADGAEVVIFDHRKNMHDDCGDGSSLGIYKNIEVNQHTEEEIVNGCIPLATLSFDNEDFDDEPVQKEVSINDWIYEMENQGVSISNTIKRGLLNDKAIHELVGKEYNSRPYTHIGEVTEDSFLKANNVGKRAWCVLSNILNEHPF